MLQFIQQHYFALKLFSALGCGLMAGVFFATERLNFSQSAIAKYQDIIEIVSDDHRIMRSQILGDDGNWQQFMTAHYRRNH